MASFRQIMKFICDNCGFEGEGALVTLVTCSTLSCGPGCVMDYNISLELRGSRFKSNTSPADEP